MTTKEQIKEMMNNINGILLYEDENALEYENPCYGESIVFDFENNILIRIYS